DGGLRPLPGAGVRGDGRVGGGPYPAKPGPAQAGDRAGPEASAARRPPPRATHLASRDARASPQPARPPGRHGGALAAHDARARASLDRHTRGGGRLVPRTTRGAPKGRDRRPRPGLQPHGRAAPGARPPEGGFLLERLARASHAPHRHPRGGSPVAGSRPPPASRPPAPAALPLHPPPPPPP